MVNRRGEALLLTIRDKKTTHRTSFKVQSNSFRLLHVFFLYEREILGEFVVKCPTKMTLRNSSANSLGDVFVSNGTVRAFVLTVELFCLQ